jgi:hypothetical protein
LAAQSSLLNHRLLGHSARLFAKGL